MNTIGMIAWLMTLYTPECPRGRRIILIANDITYSNGTFGPVEDVFFQRASELARHLGIPRIYMSSNSGTCLSPPLVRSTACQSAGSEQPSLVWSCDSHYFLPTWSVDRCALRAIGSCEEGVPGAVERPVRLFERHQVSVAYKARGRGSRPRRADRSCVRVEWACEGVRRRRR